MILRYFINLIVTNFINLRCLFLCYEVVSILFFLFFFFNKVTILIDKNAQRVERGTKTPYNKAKDRGWSFGGNSNQKETQLGVQLPKKHGQHNINSLGRDNYPCPED
jgi:hypothetical protein